MRSIISKSALAALLLAFFVGCVQPPTPPSSDIEVSDENNNTVTTQAIPTNGLKGDYYDNLDFTGTLKTRYDATVNKAWNSSAPITGIQPMTYSVRWTGQIMPTFSETYTFTLTYGDGARLKVNGQVLVNDWVDGAKRTKTGTVALQANTKYDIRLEYYRNTTNPGAVKLEWQSSSRSKQIVPQASLFTTGSNLQVAMQTLRSDARISSTNLVFDNSNAVGVLGKNGAFYLVATASVSRDVIVTTLNGNTVETLLRIQKLATSAQITDLIDGTTLSLDNTALYFDATGTQNDQQRLALRRKIAEFLGKGLFQVTSATIQSGGSVKPQGVVSDIFCPLIIKEPPSCVLDACGRSAQNLQSTMCSYTGFVEDAVVTVLFPPAGVAEWIYDGVSLGKAALQGFSPKGARDDYIKCVRDNQADRCLIAWSVTPSSITERLPLGRGRKTLIIKNDSATTLNSQSTPEGPSIWVDSSYRQVIGESSGGLAGSFGLHPGTSTSVSVDYNCKNDGEIIKGLYEFTEQASGLEKIVTIIINCFGIPQISVSPSSLSLVAAINSSTIGTLTVSNTGTSALSYTASENSARIGITSGESGLVNPDASTNIQIRSQCGSALGFFEDSLIISSNDLLYPDKNLTVKTNCTTDSNVLVIIWGLFPFTDAYGNDQQWVKYSLLSYNGTQKEYVDLTACVSGSNCGNTDYTNGATGLNGAKILLANLFRNTWYFQNSGRWIDGTNGTSSAFGTP
jgi:PA14 domain